MTKENPVRGVKLYKENNRRLRFLLVDEMRSLIDNCQPHLRPIVITALNTGMRVGEILGLRWDEVDFDRGQILVRTSKNGEPRHVEMNGLLADTLRQMQRRPQNPYVFGSRDGNPYADIRKSFKSALAASGIAEFRFHDLRHTFASHLVMNGVDLMTVKELLGHKTIQMTLRYSHLSQGHKKKAVEAIGSILDGHFLDTKAENAEGTIAGQVCKAAI
jgi:integrase